MNSCNRITSKVRKKKQKTTKYHGGVYSHQNCTWMCLPDLENLTFSWPIFCPISHPSVYHFRKKSTQLTKLGTFYNNLSKIHPSYVMSLMKPPSLYQISQKSAPKGRHIYLYHVNVRTPQSNNVILYFLCKLPPVLKSKSPAPTFQILTMASLHMWHDQGEWVTCRQYSILIFQYESLVHLNCHILIQTPSQLDIWLWRYEQFYEFQNNVKQKKLFPL